MLVTQVNTNPSPNFLQYKTYVFLDWDLSIYEFYYIKNDFARRLSSIGKTVIRLGCTGSLSDCTNYQAVNRTKWTSTTSGICSQCIARQASCICSTQNKIDPNANTHTLDNTTEQHLRKLALQSFVMNEKTSLINDSNRAYYDTIYASVLQAYIAGRSRRDNPGEAYVCVNDNYSINRAYGYGFGADGVNLEPELYALSSVLSYYVTAGGLKVRPDIIPLVRQHIPASWKYCTPADSVVKSISNRVIYGDYNTYRGDSPDSKIAANYANKMLRYDESIVLFLSSPEEVEGNLASEINGIVQAKNKFGFTSQNDAISFFHQCALASPSKLFIVRIHPRMLPNSRFRSTSPYYEELVTNPIFASCDNLVLSTETGITSYELAALSSFCLVSWGSLGNELPALRLPCTILFPEYCLYPIGLLVDQPSSRSELTNQIDTPESRPSVTPERVSEALQGLYADQLMSTSMLSFRWAAWRSPLLRRVVAYSWAKHPRLCPLVSRIALLYQIISTRLKSHMMIKGQTMAS